VNTVARTTQILWEAAALFLVASVISATVIVAVRKAKARGKRLFATRADGPRESSPPNRRPPTGHPVSDQTNEPQLGLATTLQLIVELAARAHVSAVAGEMWPGYSTVGGYATVEPAASPAEAVEADDYVRATVRAFGLDPDEAVADRHATLPEPSPVQVEAEPVCICHEITDTYPDPDCPVHGNPAPAEDDPIEALVQAFVADWFWPGTTKPDGLSTRLHRFAARVAEVGGQQPGVPKAATS
jgi:hypothetical protein